MKQPADSVNTFSDPPSVDADAVSLQMAAGRRYLAPFDPKRIPHFFTDVLVIGAGISGSRAALEIDPKLQVTLVTKGQVEVSNSAWAQGGIAGALDPDDHVSDHAADTIRVGCGLCNDALVNDVVAEAPALIRELISFGAAFDEHEGEIALTREGGHSHNRVAHALGDATGKEIMRALLTRVANASNCDVWQDTFTVDLLTHEGRCRGALVWNPEHGKTFVWAKQTILCTGGAGQLYRETTNPSVATADGHALAFRAGATLRDMEMMQFHPTVLYIAGSSRFLISEAARGEGAYLLDSHGERFMTEYHDRAELAPRDVVSRAITKQMEKTRHPCVYLSLAHLDPKLVATRFPSIGETCASFGLDLAKDPIPVRPGAHYMIGGVVVDRSGRTTLPGLWAAGEATSTGLHGANRLASNSLLEGLYFGKRCGAGASEVAGHIPDQLSVVPIEPDQAPDTAVDQLDLSDLKNSLQSLMGRLVGIRRDAEGLEEATDQTTFWDRFVSRRGLNDQSGWEFQNMLLVAQLAIQSATAREESRGVHYRDDFPKTETAWRKHVVVTRTCENGR